MTLTPLLCLFACGDYVEAPLLTSELTNRDLQLTDLGDRVTALEATVTSQTSTIAQQAALIDAQQDTIDAQAQAIAALEATMNDDADGVGARVDALEATVSEVFATLDAQAAIADELLAELTALGGRVGSLEASSATMADTLAMVVSEATTLGTRVSAAEANVTDLQADVADLQADSGGGGGGVWSDEGSGSGNCARANVTTTSAGPLYVFATVDATFSMSGGCGTAGLYSCYSTTGASGIPYTSGSTTGAVSINAENAAGTWSDVASTTTSMNAGFYPATVNASSSTYYIYSGYSASSHSWTVPLQTVLDIPAAGSYIIDLDVTGISGACSLVVLQP